MMVGLSCKNKQNISTVIMLRHVHVYHISKYNRKHTGRRFLEKQTCLLFVGKTLAFYCLESTEENKKNGSIYHNNPLVFLTHVQVGKSKKSPTKETTFTVAIAPGVLSLRTPQITGGYEPTTTNETSGGGGKLLRCFECITWFFRFFFPPSKSQMAFSYTSQKKWLKIPKYTLFCGCANQQQFVRVCERGNNFCIH